jgi:hypothetical protein
LNKLCILKIVALWLKTTQGHDLSDPEKSLFRSQANKRIEVHVLLDVVGLSIKMKNPPPSPKRRAHLAYIERTVSGISARPRLSISIPLSMMLMLIFVIVPSFAQTTPVQGSFADLTLEIASPKQKFVQLEPIALILTPSATRCGSRLWRARL